MGSSRWAPHTSTSGIEDLASSDAPFAIATGRTHPKSLVADDTAVYWAEGRWDQPDNAIVMSPRSGGGVVSLTTAGAASVFALAADDVYLYAADNYGGTVWKVAKGGGAIATLATDQPYPFDIGVDDSAVYWASETTAELCKVGK